MARRLSKEEQQLLETQSLNQWLAEEYERRNRFAGVEGGVTSTASPFEPPAPVEVEEEEASPWPSLAERALSNPLNPFSPLMNREVRDSVLGFGGTLLESAGAITDAIAPDPHPIAMGMDDYERGLTPGLYARSALEHVRDLGGSLAQLGGSVADWAGIPQESLVPIWAGDASGAAQAVRNRQAADIARERAEAGMIGAEDLRQRALPNRIADVLYGAGEALGGAVSPELQAAQQGLGEAIEGGAGSTLRFLASPQGARAFATGILPQTGAYAAQGFGMGALGRSARLPASLSTAASNTTLAYTVAQQNANEVEQGILGLSDEEAILNPVIREEWLRTRDLEGAKAHAARAARQQTIAASVPVAPLYGIDIFSRAGAGVGSRATQTMQSRLGRSLAVEGAGEFAQEAGEALAADFGQVGGGQMAAEDVGQTALAQGMLGSIASAPIAGGMTYGQARSEFGQRADEVEQAAERLEALYAARAAEEQARAAEAEAEAAAPSDDIDVEAGNALLRTVEENAANEAARVALSEVPAMTSGRFTPEAGPVDMEEEARRNELLLALEPENEAEQEAWRLLREMPAGSDLDGRPVRGEGGRFTGERIAPAESVQLRDSRGRLTTQRAGQAPVPSPDVDALTRDSQRLADSLVAEQQAEAETDDAQITRDRQVQEAREFDQREQERGDEAARKRLATARGEHTRNRRAHLAGVREANMHLDPDARAEAIADAAAEWDVDNPRPTLETLPPEAPRAPRRRAAARPAPTQEELAEAGLEAEEAVVAPTEEAVDVEADLRARYGRAQEGGEAPAGRTAAEVLRKLAPRVRSGTDRGALEAEALLAGGKLSIVDPEVMATIEGATGSTEGYYDGERMYINAAALPAGDPVGVLFNSVLAHEANHAAASSQNPDAVSKARVLLEDAPRQKLIEQLETSTHATAEAARRAVAARDIDKQTDPARYEDEMVAYAINHAIESGGRSWAPIRGIVSAARRKMKEYTGSDNLNLDDLGYYARATVNALAESEADIAAPGMGREQVSPEVAAMQAEAEQGAQDSGLATAQAMVEGTATRTAENVMLPVELLQTIPGTINESRGPGDGQYDQLLAAVESDGFRQDRPIDVRINHRGEAFIVDGNTRVAVAAERGVSEIPANVQWMNGAENVDSPLTPAIVEGTTEPEFEGRAQESPRAISTPRAADDPVLYSPYLDKLKKLDEDWSYLADGTDIVEAINNRDERAIRELASEARSAYDDGEVDFTPNELNALDNLMGWNAGSGTSDIEAIRSRPMFRGNPKGTSGTVYSTDGALGPGVYLTSSRDGAGSYGPVVEQYTMDVYNPLIITMEEVIEVEGNTALAIAGNTGFADENFHTRRAALNWARKQWEDWSGIGDVDFPSMLRDAGFDSVVLMDGDTIVEANVLSQRNAIPYDEQAPFEGRAQESPSSEPRATASSGMGPAPLSRHAANFAKDVFTWHGRGGKRMGNLLEHNAGIRDSYYSKALANAYRAEGGIRDLSGRWAAENGVSRSEAATQIRSMLSDRFDLISRLPNLAAREKALSKLVQTYPELSPVRDAVQDVTALTENIITQRMKNPAPLSASEKELYTYLDRNRGAYLTSAYALFQGPAGKDWGKNLARLAHDGFDRLAKDPQARLPSHIKAAYDVYKRALDFVVANDVAINNPEQILAMSDDDVSRAHDLWAPRGESAADLKARMEDEGTYVEKDFKEVLGDRLMEWVDNAVATPAGKAQIENLGKAEINALLKLAPPAGPARRYAKAAGVDDSILKHKKDLPAELEGLFGKMHDIPSLLTLTAIKQGELASRFSLFNDLRAEQSADGTMVAVTAEERAANPGRYGQHSVQLTGDNYGAIQDMFVTPETSGVLNKYNDTFSTLIDTFAELGTTTIITDILDRTGKAAEATLGRANRWYKTMAIPTRIDHAVMNGIGSIATPVMAGGVKRGHIARGLAVAKAQVLQTLDPTNRTGISKPSPEVARDLELATLMGITDNVVLTDIRKHPRKLVNQFVDDMMKAGTVGELRAGAKKWARRGGRGWRAWVETFSLSDTWIRLPIALERMDFLESFYKANGETKTNEQIMQEAAEFSKNATLTPTRIPGAVKGAERWGATMYGSYMWNVPRVLAYGGIHALQSFDMARKATTPEARDIAAWDGIRKTAGMGLAMLALTEGFRRAAHMMMDDDDREMVDHDRAFLMGEAAVGDLVYLGKDEEGHNMYTILSRIDPYGPVLDIIRAIRRTNGVGDSWDTIVDGASELSIRSAMLPHVAKIFSHAFGEEEVFYRPSRLERMFPELVSKAKNATADVLGMVGRERGRGYRDAEAVLETLSMLIPAGVANRFDSLNPSVSEQDAKIMSESIAVMEALGHKFVVVRPEAAIKGAAFDLRDLHTDSRRQIQQTLRASGPQAAVSTYARQAEEERALVERLGKMYDAAVAKGNSPRAVQDFMKDARLDATTIRNISQGLYATESNDWAVEHSAVLSKALRDRPPADLSEEELAEWNDKVNEMIELIDVMGIKEKK